MTWTEREWFFPSQVSTIILYNWIIDCWVHLSSTAGRLQYDHATASPQPRYSQPIREKASSTVEFLHMLWIDPNGHEGHSSSLWFDTLNTGRSQVDHIRTNGEVRSGELEIQGGVYDLKSGRVELPGITSSDFSSHSPNVYHPDLSLLSRHSWVLRMIEGDRP